MTVSIVTQTSVRPEKSEDFARWQGETSNMVSNFPGFVEQRLMPPNPPLQVDWVILQRFHTMEDAQRWLVSPERQTRIEGAAPFLIGRDDVHIVRDDEGGRKPAPVSAVISTRVKPGKDTEYRAWERKIAAAQSKAPGLQGYRFEPPVPGVQDDWLAILRFDTEHNLQAWLESPERKKLLEEAAPFLEEFHTRMVRSGFEQWFPLAVNGTRAPAWKQNMIVLLLLYPVVFLFSIWVQSPVLMAKAGLPFWLALFIGNIVSVMLLNWLVPWVSNGFGWWLAPAACAGRWTSLAGAALILLLYAAWLFLFSRIS
jgi:antibiotic biosynthesis monooxygenase (ABM) superfamily enzyme